MESAAAPTDPIEAAADDPANPPGPFPTYAQSRFAAAGTPPPPGSSDTLLPTPPAARWSPPSPLSIPAPRNTVTPAENAAPAPGPADPYAGLSGITDAMRDSFLQSVIDGPGSGADGGAQRPTAMWDLEEQLHQLEHELADLRGQLRYLQGPGGPSRVFLAQMDGTGTNRTMEEVVPTGTAVQHLEVSPDGRQVFDGSIKPLIPIPAGTCRAVMQYLAGSSSAYVELPIGGLKLGKIVSVSACNSFAIVKECDNAGTVIDETLVSVLPTKGGCDGEPNAFCYNVGDVIAYEPNPFDPTTGYQVGAYRAVNVDYSCTSGTNEVFVKDLKRLRLNPADFHLEAGAECPDGGTSFTNRGTLYARGVMVKGYQGSSNTGGISCGSFAGSTANAASLGGVKLFDFDSANGPPPSAAGTNYTNIPFFISCSTTNATVPPIGGGCGSDASGPYQVKVQVQAKTGDITYVSNVTCNEDGTITVTTSRTTVVLPTT